MPISSPLITVPTTCPRSFSLASDELIGTITWATVAVTPITASAAANTRERRGGGGHHQRGRGDQHGQR